MKRFLFLILPLLSLVSCQKEEKGPIIIVEPPEDRLIAADTLLTGEKWGLAIGESAEVLYARIKELGFSKPVTYLGVVGNVFTGIDGLESKIPLYQSVFLDETKGTSSGIQISFSNDKVSAIYTNEGKPLARWPSSLSMNANTVISKGDPVNKVYGKLENIRKINAYSKKFKRVSIFSKDVSKAYDVHMSASPQWYFVASADEKKHYQIFLDLKDGKLISLSYRLYEKM